jgi:hypothetical protein
MALGSLVRTSRTDVVACVVRTVLKQIC